jgi:hypothetical protein
VDSYGETDDGLRRGNPLRLDSERYETMNKMWLTHSVPDKISGKYDPELMIMRADWNTY